MKQELFSNFSPYFEKNLCFVVVFSVPCSSTMASAVDATEILKGFALYSVKNKRQLLDRVRVDVQASELENRIPFAIMQLFAKGTPMADETMIAKLKAQELAQALVQIRANLPSTLSRTSKKSLVAVAQAVDSAEALAKEKNDAAAKKGERKQARLEKHTEKQGNQAPVQPEFDENLQLKNQHADPPERICPACKQNTLVVTMTNDEAREKNSRLDEVHAQRLEANQKLYDEARASAPRGTQVTQKKTRRGSRHQTTYCCVSHGINCNLGAPSGNCRSCRDNPPALIADPHGGANDKICPCETCMSACSIHVQQGEKQMVAAQQSLKDNDSGASGRSENPSQLGLSGLFRGMQNAMSIHLSGGGLSTADAADAGAMDMLQTGYSLTSDAQRSLQHLLPARTSRIGRPGAASSETVHAGVRGNSQHHRRYANRLKMPVGGPQMSPVGAPGGAPDDDMKRAIQMSELDQRERQLDEDLSEVCCAHFCTCH